MSVGFEGIGVYIVTISEEPQTVEALILISNGVLSTNTLVFGVSNYKTNNNIFKIKKLYLH